VLIIEAHDQSASSCKPSCCLHAHILPHTRVSAKTWLAANWVAPVGGSLKELMDDVELRPTTYMKDSRVELIVRLVQPRPSPGSVLPPAAHAGHACDVGQSAVACPTDMVAQLLGALKLAEKNRQD
jgi:hypothetical protein